LYHRPISQYWIIRHKGKPANQNPAIRDRRLGQFSTGDSVKNSPALTTEIQIRLTNSCFYLLFYHSFLMSSYITSLTYYIYYYTLISTISPSNNLLYLYRNQRGRYNLYNSYLSLAGKGLLPVNGWFRLGLVHWQGCLFFYLLYSVPCVTFLPVFLNSPF
jgi:hypothetical protein